MASRTGTAHVVTTKRRYKDQVYCTHLLRRSYREDGKVKNETLSNLSHLPEPLIDLIRRSLKGENFVSADQAFTISSSRAHGHVQAVSLAMQRLGFAGLLASKPCPERDLVAADGGFSQSSALPPNWPPHACGTPAPWRASFGVADATEDDLYASHGLVARRARPDSKEVGNASPPGRLPGSCTTSHRATSRARTARWPNWATAETANADTLQVNYGLLTDDSGLPGGRSPCTRAMPRTARRSCRR